MATHASAVKRARQNEKRKKRNKALLSQVTSSVKNVLNTKEKEQAEAKLKDAVSVIDKAAVKRKIHPNNAARKKARITKHVNSLS